MLDLICAGRGEVCVMSSDEKAKTAVAGKINASDAKQHYTGAVTIARSNLICGQNLMTASNPAANAAVAVAPAFVSVKFGGKS